MRWVITSAKELRDGVFTEGEIPPHNLKAMNFKTLLQHGMQQERHPLKRGRGALGQKRLIERSFEHDQIPQSLETEKGLNRLNPKAVDPSSLDRFNPKAVELDKEDNTSMPELPIVSPTLGFDIPENPIEDEILKSGEQLGPNPEDLNANDLIDPNDFSNLDDLLDGLENLDDLIEDVVASGTHNGKVDVAKNLAMLMDNNHPLGINSLNFPENGNTDGENEDDQSEDDQSGAWDNPDGDWWPNWADFDNDDDGTWDWNDSDPNDPSKSIMAGDNESSLPPWIFHLDDSAENKFADVLTNTNEELLAKGVATDLEHGPGFEEVIIADQGTFGFGGMAQSALETHTFEASTLVHESVMSQPMSINTMPPITDI